ncbi:S-layer homology domain-containing protein [Ureibacillus aquaedulcis]|uniref:S-layer homology domain-containing protein n=1 Tax=Ureibacillus aquaedulcis TaxID=3058421 RepID=A0ABT8GL56_9BACL|nr:S-layer homology domain-containing protein [Ureibacillus sp. BA0131]MDN4492144.1 S-layer homology domain-containing protein [Ureibacillus sp. BA0131]
MTKQNKGRKLFATTATAALVASAIVPVASAAELNDFDSVASWAKDAVKSLVDSGAVQGDNNGNFNPTKELTRAQGAEILAKVLDLKAEGTEDYSDVTSSNWFYDAVRATSPELFIGNEKGEFNPNDNLTRQEAAKVLVNAFELSGSESLDSFRDASKAGKWAINYLETAVANGVINGKGSLLAPTDTITNQEFATMVKRAQDAAVPAVTAVSATNTTDLKVTLGGNLKDVTVTAEDFEVTVDGTKVSFTVEKVSEKEYTLKLSSALVAGAKVEVVGLKDLDGSKASTTYSPISITSVDAVATTVVDNKDGQTLKIKANGVETTPAELAAQGYTVSFVASKNVFGAAASTSTTGELDEAQLATLLSSAKQTDFTYRVSVQKDNVVVTSKSADVLIIDADQTAVSEIKTVDLGDVAAVGVNNNATSASYTIDTLTGNKLVVGETVDVEGVVATLADGRNDIDLIATTGNVSYESSDVRIATVSGNTITAKGVGTVTIKVKSGNISKDITLQIVEAPRKLSLATVSKSSLNLAHGAAVPVLVTLKDQYGETFGSKTDLVPVEAKNTANTAITTTTAAGGTDDATNGEFYYTITAATGVTGAGKVEFNHANSAKLASTSVTVGAAASTTTFKLELNKNTINLNPASTDSKITLTLNEYGASGQYVGAADLDDYTVEIFDANGTPISNITGANLEGAVDNGIYELTRHNLIAENANAVVAGTTYPSISNFETGTGLIKVTDTVSGDVYSANFTITDSAPTVNSATFLDGFEIKSGVNVTAPLSTFLTKVGTTATAGDGIVRYEVDGTDANLVHMYYETANTPDGYDYGTDVYLGRLETNFVSGGSSAVLDFTTDGSGNVTFDATADTTNATFQFDVVKRGAATTASSVVKKNIVVKP